MEIFYVISADAIITEDFVAKVYEASSPGAEVDSVNIPAPHTAQVSVTFLGRDKIPHIIKLIGVTSGKIYHKYDFLPKENIVTVFDPIIFKIGDGGTNTPAVGTHTYINTDMASITADDYVIYRNGYGFLVSGLHFDNRVGGGFVLKQSGDQFGDGEEFLIQRSPKGVGIPVNDSVVGKLFGPGGGINDIFIDITAPTDYDPTHLRKLIRLAGANAVYTFPVAANIPIGYGFRFTNFGPYALITDTPEVHFNNAPLLSGNTTLTVFTIPFKGVVEFVFDGTSWNCTMDNTGSLGTPPAGIVSYIGNVNVGNIVYENSLTVTIPDQGSGNYTVLGSLREQSGNVQLAVSWTIRNKTNTSFKLYVGEWGEVTQDLRFEYVIVK